LCKAKRASERIVIGTSVNWRLAADEDLIEFICQENNVDEKFLK
jgi:hypothetical protein